MYKIQYTILCVCVSLGVVLCDLDKEEGADCDWEGVKGKCVEETRCMTTLDTESSKHLICSKKGEFAIICCTDCELVDDTRKVAVIPNSEKYVKDGRGKARDHCIQYLKELPYDCTQRSHRLITTTFDGANKCHRYNITEATRPTLPVHYPHQVLLGFPHSEAEPSLETAQWLAGGSIISDRFILTAAHVVRGDYSPLYVAAHVQNRSESPSQWQTHKVKRFIPHPEYKPPSKYNDIALIETETSIIFDKNVLPACLHVDEEARDIEAVATTWRDVENKNYKKMLDTIQSKYCAMSPIVIPSPDILSDYFVHVFVDEVVRQDYKVKLEKFTKEECKSFYGPTRLLRQGFDYTTQMCYGNKADPGRGCMGLSGEPLLIDSQFSHCVHTVIGVTSFGFNCRAGKPDVYTRVAPYISWIESVVWP